PAEFARETWSHEDALVELLRSRLTGLGPTPVAALTAALALPQSDVDFHLLARIHRYTIGKLRREIEPVEPRDFMRFLFEWQRVSKASQVSGPEALAG